MICPNIKIGYQKQEEKKRKFRFLHRVAPYMSNGFLPYSDYGITIESHQTKVVSDSISLPTRNRVQLEIVSFPRPYRITLSQLRSSFCSSLRSYCERLELIPTPLCPSCGVVPHATVHAFSCSSNL